MEKYTLPRRLEPFQPAPDDFVLFESGNGGFIQSEPFGEDRAVVLAHGGCRGSQPGQTNTCACRKGKGDADVQVCADHGMCERLVKPPRHELRMVRRFYARDHWRHRNADLRPGGKNAIERFVRQKALQFPVEAIVFALASGQRIEFRCLRPPRVAELLFQRVPLRVGFDGEREPLLVFFVMARAGIQPLWRGIG